MPNLSVEHGLFEKREEALAEIEESGLRPIEFDSPAGSKDAHWHEFYSQTYVLEGTLEVTDTESGVTHSCGPGSRLTAPARTVHSEVSTDLKLIVAISVDPSEITQPLDKDPEDL